MVTPGMLLWSWSNLTLFNLHDKRHGIIEDSIKKPWRPLPAKRLTPEQATWAIYCMYPVVLITSLIFGGLGLCVIEAFACLHYNECGGSSSPFLKNLLNGIGFACFLAGPLEVATGESVLQSPALMWMSIIAFAVTTTSHAQDFREMDGDRTAGRKTVPLIIGDTNARLLVAAGVISWNGIACWVWQVRFSGFLAWIMDGAMVGDFFWDRNKEGDTRSWKIFPLWLLGLTVIPLG
jgi:4-hydroxybenzoate polyprenyltransferase